MSLIKSYRFIILILTLSILQSCNPLMPTAKDSDFTFEQSSESSNGGNVSGSTYCELANPELKITPSNFSLLSGDPISFEIAVTNKSKNCSNPNFIISAQAGNGLDTSSIPTSIQVADNSSSTVRATIATSQVMFPGRHSFSIMVFDQKNPNLLARADATVTITIVPQCIRTAPSISYSVPSLVGEVGQSFNKTLNIRNNDQNCLTNNYQITHTGGLSGLDISGVNNVVLESGQAVSLPLTINTEGASAGSATMTTSLSSANGGSQTFLSMNLTAKQELFKITQVNVASIGDKSAQINWSSDQEVSGVLHYGTTQSLGMQSPSSVKLSHTHQLSNLTPDTRYYYQVRAVDSQGKQVSSAMSNFETNKTPVMIVMPSIVSRREDSNYIVTLSQAGDIPQGGYNVLVNNQLRSDLSVNNNMVIISGLDDTQENCFKLRAIYSQIDPVQSIDSLDSCVQPVEQPLAPIISSAQRIGDNYQISFMLAPTSMTPTGGYDTVINNVDQGDNANYSGLTRTITGLNKLVRQCFKIQARYLQVDPSVFPESEEVCVEPFVPAPDTQAPSVPMGLAQISKTQNSIVFGWNASNDNTAVTSYVIQNNNVNVGNSQALSFTLNNLTPNTAYNLKVAARDAAGNQSAFSSVLSITTNDEAEKTGAELYAINCQQCHNGLAQSSKKNTTAARISDAIVNNTVMNAQLYLRNLTSSEVQKIALALDSGEAVPGQVVLGTNHFVASKFSVLFNSATPNQEISGAIYDLIKSNNKVPFGGTCALTESHCTGELEARVNAPMIPRSQAARSATLFNACQKVLAVDQAVTNALSRAGLMTSSPANSVNVNKLYELFFPGVAPVTATTGGLAAIHTEARSRGSNELNAWRMVMDPMCKSNLFEMF